MRAGIFFLGGLLLLNLTACNTAPEDVNIKAERVAATILAAQAAQYPSSTLPPHTAAPSPTRRPTSTPLPPSSTPEPTRCSGILITERKTSEGIYLLVFRCSDDLKYELGPLAQGAYAVGPNEEFLVYCSIDGSVYAAKIGSPKLIFLESIKKELNPVLLNQAREPALGLSFVGDYPYTVEIYVCPYGSCPSYFTETAIKVAGVRIPLNISH